MKMFLISLALLVSVPIIAIGSGAQAQSCNPSLQKCN